MMKNNIIDNCLYIFNFLICIPGIILFLYYFIHNIMPNNCQQLFVLSLITLINSLLCLAFVKELKIIGWLTTISIFIYKSYNIVDISNNCIINNKTILYYYVFTLIVNGINIILYLIAFINYMTKKKIITINN